MRKFTLHCWFCVLLGLSFATGFARGEEAPVVPTEPIILFNGKDLAPFYTYIEDKKYEDPQRVFTIVDALDGKPAIRISGEGAFGGLITRKSYANYRLVAEFRWGELTWGNRATKSRDSGIL
ncbi:MAG: family 16 glycoside hydrolase, partial [Planctomycetales bacterium]